MIIVAEKEVESLTSYLNDIEHLYEHGAATQNDLLPARVKLADARQNLIVARNARVTSAARLNNMLTLPLRKRIKVRDIAMELPHLPEMEQAWTIAQLQRPEIKIVDSQMSASSLREKAAMVENLPKVFADGGYSYTQNKFVLHQDTLYLNLGVKANLFDGGAAKAEVSRERSMQRQFLEQKNKLVDDIKFEIEDSFYSLRDAREKVFVAKQALSEAEENVRVNRVKYTEGAATSTDVLEAITLQTNALTNYYNSGYELKRSYAKLMYSMGIDLGLIYDTITKRETDGAKK